MFSLATPWLLLLLPLPWVIRYILPKAKYVSSAALKIPFYQALLALSAEKHSTSKASKAQWLLAFLIWFLLLFAASGPQLLGKPVNLPRSGRDIMLAVDLSGSMEVPDMTLNGKRVNRLTVVKAAAEKFIQARKGDRLGLILFGTHAYLQTPLTFDRKTVAQMLDDATIGLAGNETAIGDAIGLAIKVLAKAPQKSRVLILLTDGGNNSGVVAPIEAAKVAAKEHIKIYTIGLGASQMVVQGIFGPQVINPTNQLDEKTLKEIAQITGGVFFRAENTADLNHVYQTLNKLVPVAGKTNQFRPVKQLYPWPLGFALLLIMLVMWRRTDFYGLKSSRTNNTMEEATS